MAQIVQLIGCTGQWAQDSAGTVACQGTITVPNDLPLSVLDQSAVSQLLTATAVVFVVALGFRFIRRLMGY